MTIAATNRPAPAQSGRQRSAWIDRLRASLTLLVIMHHAAIAYGASGDWFFKATDATNLPLTFFAAVNQAFFMGMFFMIAGALAPASLARKGRAAFLKDRALRLGAPVLAFGFLLGPLTVALATAAPGEVVADAAGRVLRGDFVIGPLWFPAALLTFSAVLAFRPATAETDRPAPPFPRWLGLALATGAAALLIRQAAPVGASFAGFQPGYFASYVVLFAVGAQAGRNGWLDPPPQRGLRLATAVGLLALPVLPAVLLSDPAPRFETGFSAAAIVYAFWEPLVALGAVSGLILWSRSRGERSAAFWSWAAANSYGAFILHAPILVAASRGLDGLGVPHGPALPLSIVATALAAFGLAALLRRSATARRVI